MSAGSASSMPSSHLCEASPTFAKPGSTSRSRCDDERVVVGIARIDERRRRIELVAGLDAHDPHARRRCRSPTRTRARPSTRSTGRVSAYAGVVRERASRGCPGSTMIRRSGAARNELERGREPRMRGERGVGIGAAFAQHVERVAREDDHRRAATPFDRVRDRPRHFTRTRRFRPARAAGRRTPAPRRRSRSRSAPRRRRVGRRDARSTSSAPGSGAPFVRLRTRPSSSPTAILGVSRPHLGQPRRPRDTVPVHRQNSRAAAAKRGDDPGPRRSARAPVQATATPSNAAARTPAARARPGTAPDRARAPRPCTPGRSSAAARAHRRAGPPRPRAPRPPRPRCVRRRRRPCSRSSPSRRPHTSTARRAPLALVAEAPAQARPLRRLAELHADARDVGKRVDEQRGAAGHGAAVARADRFREPHEAVAVRMVFAPGPVVPRAHRHPPFVAHGRDARRPRPTRAGHLDLVDGSNIDAAWRASASTRPGASPHPMPIATPAPRAFGSSTRS